MFGFEPYHILLVAIGGAIVLSYWLPRFLSGREPAASALLVLTGALAFQFVPGMPEALNPTRQPRIWELGAELCVIIGLFGTGLRIDRINSRVRWMPTVRLLTIAMPLTILALAVLGWAAAGMTLAGGLLLGAVLAPTDPVLAGDVQVGPPHEGGEHPVRYALTTEAGLNDGLAFPFVHLGILLAGAGMMTWELALEWTFRDLIFRVIVGVLGGLACGWVLGRVLFDWPRENPLSRTESGVIAFAGVLIAYGFTELVEGYGFIAAFVAGVTLRRVEQQDEFHKRLHDFSESLEHTLTALLLVALGAALPALWPYLDWEHAFIALGLIFVIRPVAAYVSLHGTALRARQRIVTAFYGVRGIGSIYYLAYAGHHVELVNEETLWATVALTIVLSTVVHGLTAGIAVERVTGELDSEEAQTR
ncbi:cation:proton antiporter [Qipengyuania sediminis]|uniref:cation:proton antiporter n=1 Tax=Qipengyuania sediminis TaxID=1532023 RepID=UPI0010599BF5|nr:cation:proton antiporter [Qipengyuania sediminis]